MYEEYEIWFYNHKRKYKSWFAGSDLKREENNLDNTF